jgi:hypothetical protein
MCSSTILQVDNNASRIAGSQNKEKLSFQEHVAACVGTVEFLVQISQRDRPVIDYVTWKILIWLPK